MKILKFGGSSVGSPERIRNIAKIISSEYRPGGGLAVVVSAYQGVTDSLIQIADKAAAGEQSYRDDFKKLCDKHINYAQELLPLNNQSSVLANIKVWINDLDDILHGVFLVGEYSKRMLDYVMSFGERLSAYTISSFLNSSGLAAEFVDTRELIICDNSWGSGKVDFSRTNPRIKDYFENYGKVGVATGFIGATPNNDTITLGRGGSDYTAAIIGAAVKASEIQIWSDVDGVMTADPRKVSKAFYIPALTYQEIMELSHFGAKVVYPPTIQPALDANIPVSIKNSFNPGFSGTRISADSGEHPYLITGISSIEKISLLRLEGSGMIGVAGVSMRLFAALAKKEISVILITQASSEHTICFAVLPNQAEEAKRAIESEFALELKMRMIEPVEIDSNVSIVSVVGENMRRTPGISAKLFRALGNNGINIIAIAQGSSELNISVVISQADEKKALNALHDEFFLSETKTLNLFMVGTGLIGSTLLEQIKNHESQLKKDLNLELKIMGICNSRQSLIGEGLKIASLKQDLAGGSPRSIGDFVEKILAMNLPNSIFVDCSASDEVIKHYDKILDRSIAVITPNKKAQTQSLEAYRKLKQTARKRGVPWLYETSVGAGLPVINTLNDLIKSGDSIIRIEAVLSGTLSFIFNSFSTERPFSEVVKEAKEKGYTEPDPRDDLCGLDFGRKLLILAREAGMALEQKDVQIENLVPESCRGEMSVDKFFECLKREDPAFSAKAENAAKNARKLCYIGVVEQGSAKVSLQEIDNTHPFSSLSGSDNIISFTTTRYNQRPLVVKGPGAGAEVTAAGVFADIIRVAEI